MDYKVTKHENPKWDIKIDTRFIMKRDFEIMINTMNGIRYALFFKNHVSIKIGQLFTKEEIIDAINEKINQYLKIKDISSSSKKDLNQLLKEAIQNENYELASVINKRLREISFE